MAYLLHIDTKNLSCCFLDEDHNTMFRCLEARLEINLIKLLLKNRHFQKIHTLQLSPKLGVPKKKKKCNVLI